MRGGTTMRAGLRILVVEDYEPFRRLACLELQQRAEFQVIGEASDGLEAVEKVQELKPDLVLLDIGLPKLNGLEAAKQIRKVYPHARLLFVSQESSSELIGEAFRLGARGYVHKQRAQIDLFPAIEATLAGRTFISDGLKLPESAHEEGPFCHEMLFCRNEESLLNSLSTFFTAALNAGNGAIGFVSQSHWESLLHRLSAQGVDIDPVLRRGTLISLNADEAPDPVRFFEVIKGASQAARNAGKDHPRIAFWGERAGCLWAEGKTEEAIRLERFGTDLAKGNSLDMLCVYPVYDGHVDDHALKGICAEHTAVYYKYPETPANIRTTVDPLIEKRT
jgi:DNA-binding NarL/FixJ family response regulator